MERLAKRSGLLAQRGRSSKEWKKQFFVLADGALVYYDKEDVSLSLSLSLSSPL